MRRHRGREAVILLKVDDQVGLRLLADLGPVSYTPLRAHETVLDLVCRLLLAKKNTPVT